MNLFSRTILFIGLFGITATVVISLCLSLARSPEVVYPDELDLGVREFGTEAVAYFQISNRGGTDLEVFGFATSCSCAGVEAKTDGQLKRVNSLRVAPGLAS